MVKTHIRVRIVISQSAKIYEYSRYCSNFKEVQSMVEMLKKEHWDIEQ